MAPIFRSVLIPALLSCITHVLADPPPPECTNPAATDYSGCGPDDVDACNELSRCYMYQAKSGYTLKPSWQQGSGTPNDWMEQCKCTCGDYKQFSREVTDPNFSGFSIGCEGTVWQDFNGPDSGMEINVGRCHCNDTIILALAEDVIDALPAAIEIGCMLLFGSLMLIEAAADAAAQFIPGVGEALDAGLMVSWQAAKLAKYAGETAEDALDMFTSYFTPCGTQSDNPSMQKALDWLNGLSSFGGAPFRAPRGIRPGSYVSPGRSNPKPPAPAPKQPDPPPKAPAPSPKAPAPSPASPAKSPNAPPQSQAAPPRSPDPPANSPNPQSPKPPSPSPKPPSPSPKPPAESPRPSPVETRKPRTHNSQSHRPSTSTTTTHHHSSISSEAACSANGLGDGLQERAPIRCKPAPDVTTVTSSHPVTKTVTVTCDGVKNAQACANYYSAIHAGKQNQHIRDQYTCSDDHINGRPGANGKGPNQQSDMATFSWLEQHATTKKTPWVSFTTKSFWWMSETFAVKCDRDEYPPAYFLPKDAKSNGWGQLVRLIPNRPNRSAGQDWHSFCKKHDGGRGNGQFKDGKLNMDLNSISRSSTRVHMGTTTSYVEVDFTRAIFEYDFKWRTVNGKADPPTQANDWYLWENPCWPSAIIPHDPGFALLTDDPWYTTHQFPAGYDFKATRAKYSENPAKSLTDEASKRLLAAPALQQDPYYVGPKYGPSGRGGSKRSLELLDDGFGLSEFNSSRRLTEEEMEYDLEYMNCGSSDCAAEVEDIKASDYHEPGAYVVVPGRKPSRLPVINNAPQPTEVSSITVSAQTSKRTEIDAGLPVVTISSPYTTTAL